MAEIPGTNGDDFLFGTEEDDTIRGLAGNDFILGFGGNDLLDGGDGADDLNGGGGDDELLGGNGNDALSGDAGVDTLTGGGGNDRFEWAPFGGTSTALITDVVTDFQGAGDTVGDTLELVFSGSPTRFTFGGNLAAMPLLGSSIGTGGDNLAAIFYAFSGGDTFVLADTNDNGIYDAEDFTIRLTGQHNLVQSDFGSTPIAIAGTNGPDTINGTEGNDTILALGGNDTVNGNAGNDRIEGGDGNDVVNGGDGDDNLIGGRGGDQLNGNAGNDILNGGDGNDILNGGDGIDRITGGAGSDIIDGGAGRDTVLAGGDGNDIVRGGDGTDTLDGDAGNDQLFGGNDNDTLFGLEGNDVMNGDAGNDDLFGGEGADQIFGGDGDDEIEGEEHADILTGGAGNDQFNFNTNPFQPDSTFLLHDVVSDFEGAGATGGDVIQLSGDSYAFVGNLSIDPKKGAALPGAGDGVTQLGYAQTNNNTFLIADSNDDGVLNDDDFVVQFQGLHNFTVDDFDNTDFVIAGTNGDDVITGTENGDRIFAAGGNDQVFALGGDDEVHGGTGDDFLNGGPGGFDNLLGEAGDDTLTLATSDFGGTASGGEGNDKLFGSDTSFNSFDNSLFGDAGNDDLHAGDVGSFLSGGSGADRLFSSVADDQMDGGRDEFTFALDGAQDLFVYTGTGRWSSEDTFFGDQISGFQDGSDLFDMRGSGLEFNDLTIVNEDFQTTITSDRGTITIFERFGEEVFIDQNDFLFGPALLNTSDTLII
jgi:Ca2+-binding RTX toxin-like protein